MAYPRLAHDEDNNTMMPIYLNHEAKVKEWLRQFSKKTGYQFVGYQVVGYQFVGYQ